MQGVATIASSHLRTAGVDVNRTLRPVLRDGRARAPSSQIHPNATPVIHWLVADASRALKAMIGR
jgi:hypothetical protein